MGALPVFQYRAVASFLLLAGLALGCLFLIAGTTAALSPSSVVVVANPDYAGSVEVAEYYMEAREIPEGNLLSVAGPTTEIINRTQYNEYEADIEVALEAANLTDTVEVLVLTYGVPLKVNSDDTWDYNGPQASVDGELALLVSDSMNSGNNGRHSNPYFNTQREFQRNENDDMLLVTRLDGHDKDEAMALVDEAMAAEADNAQGWAYFDRDTGMTGNYAYYDEMIVEGFNRSLERGLSSALEESAKDIGQEGALWSERSSDGAEPANGTVTPFFYWGWYSDSAYHDTFNWTRGAVGMRLHSFNAQSMRGSHWVTGAVADGISGSTGHVWEPWLDAAAYPHIVMEAFYDGYTAAEALWMGTPYLSWQNIVVVDPLYTPVQLNFTLELNDETPTLPVQPGANLTLNLTLTNHNTLHQEFDIIALDLPWGFNASVSPTRVWVNGSGGVAEVTVRVELDQDTTLVQADDYHLNVSAHPTEGPEVLSTVLVNLSVAPMADLLLETLLNNSAAPGENTTLALGLYNQGNLDDNFTLSFPLPARLENGSARWLEAGAQGIEAGRYFLVVPLEFRGSRTLLFNVTLPFDMSLRAGTVLNLTVQSRSGFDGEVARETRLSIEVDPYYGLALDPPADLQRLLAGSSAMVNFTLNNTGNAPYEVTVTAYSGAGTEWLEGSAQATLELEPQASRTVNLTLLVKADAQAGPRNMSWDLIWQGPPAAGEVTFIVQRVDVWLEQVKLLNLGYGSEPREGDPLTLIGLISSNGLPFAGNLTLNIDGIDWRTRTLDMGPADLPYRFTHNFTLEAGGYNLSLALEAPEGLFELSTSNNLAWVEGEVLPLPDLRVSSLIVAPGPPGSGKAMVNITFTTVPASWTGDDPAASFTLAPSAMALLSLDGEVIQQIWVRRPDQLNTYNLTEVAGYHNLTLVIDPEGLWNETDDDNNRVVVEFTVQGDEEAEGTDGTLLLMAAVVLIAVPAIVVLLIRKRQTGE